jgi:hypothetical protein
MLCRRISEGSTPSLVFNDEFYRKSYPDLANLGKRQAALHWANYGYRENRCPSWGELMKVLPTNFSIRNYREIYPEFSRRSDLELYLHYYQHGRFENRVNFAQPTAQLVSLALSPISEPFPSLAPTPILDSRCLVDHPIITKDCKNTIIRKNKHFRGRFTRKIKQLEDQFNKKFKKLERKFAKLTRLVHKYTISNVHGNRIMRISRM